MRFTIPFYLLDGQVAIRITICSREISRFGYGVRTSFESFPSLVTRADIVRSKLCLVNAYPVLPGMHAAVA